MIRSFGLLFRALAACSASRSDSCRDCLKWETGADPALPEYLPNDIEAGLERIGVHKDRLVIVGMGGHIFTSP